MNANTRKYTHKKDNKLLSAQPVHIAIIGGGWAGLAAALELSKHNFQISLFESSPQLGGRARSIQWKNKLGKNITLDNGQHLMIGAYQQMLELLKYMQVDTNTLFKQLPHCMLMLDAQTGHTRFDLSLPTYPAPLHLLFGVLNTPSLTFREKIKLLIRFNRLLSTPIKSDCSVDQWLSEARLPENYLKNLLEPVCLAAMTTHSSHASARAFQSVLQQTFNAPANFTDLLIPTTDLGQVFPALAEQTLLQHGVKIHTRSKIQSLQINNEQLATITIDGKAQTFDQVILATPPTVTAHLLKNTPELAEPYRQINKLKYEPVCTLYLQFESEISLPYPMIGLVNGLAEWVFERKLTGHGDILAVVISGQGAHLKLSQDELVPRILKELQTCINDLPKLLDSKLITEKRACFQCHVNVDKYRPKTDTNVTNLKLCGDYVYIEENNQPGLPSTLEGALRSGVRCAQTIISS